MWKEFKEFAIKGDAIDLAIGVVIGAAFGQVINSLVNDILNPLISLFTGRVDFGGLKFDIFGHAIKYGSFLNAAINFFIIAFVVFLVIKQINRLKKEPEVPESNEKECQFCKMMVNKNASRCPHCTSQLV